MGVYRGKKRSAYLGPELDHLVDQHLEETGQEFNTFIRAAVSNELGRPDLAGVVRMGRPSNQAAVPESPMKTARAKSAKKPARRKG